MDVMTLSHVVNWRAKRRFDPDSEVASLRDGSTGDRTRLLCDLLPPREWPPALTGRHRGMRHLIAATALAAGMACSHDCQVEEFDCNGECLSKDSPLTCGTGAACRQGPCVLDPLPRHTTPVCVDAV